MEVCRKPKFEGKVVLNEQCLFYSCRYFRQKFVFLLFHFNPPPNLIIHCSFILPLPPAHPLFPTGHTGTSWGSWGCRLPWQAGAVKTQKLALLRFFICFAEQKTIFFCSAWPTPVLHCACIYLLNALFSFFFTEKTCIFVFFLLFFGIHLRNVLSF